MPLVAVSDQNTYWVERTGAIYYRSRGRPSGYFKPEWTGSPIMSIAAVTRYVPNNDPEDHDKHPMDELVIGCLNGNVYRADEFDNDWEYVGSE